MHCDMTLIKNALLFPNLTLAAACEVNCGSQPPWANKKQNVINSLCL